MIIILLRMSTVSIRNYSKKELKLHLVFRLGLLDDFEQGRVEFELKKGRKVRF